MRGYKHNATCHPERPHYAKELCESCYNAPYGKAWRAKNKEKDKAYHKLWLEQHPAYEKTRAKRRRSIMKEKVFALLGDKCANPNCRYLNEDDTLGCRDKRLLHIDHINGGGNQERNVLNNLSSYYNKILKTNGAGYRILCANCNWLHRYEDF